LGFIFAGRLSNPVVPVWPKTFNTTKDITTTAMNFDGWFILFVLL
jgi:hypothetical protein